MEDLYDGPERRKVSDPATTQGLVEVRTSLDRLADAMEGLAAAVIEQTQDGHKSTQDRVAVLDENVKRLDAKVHYVRVLAVCAVVITMLTAMGMGTLIWRSFNVSGPRSEDTLAALQESNETLAVIRDCITPEGVCYKTNQAAADQRVAAAAAAITAQLRCDLKIECAPGQEPTESAPG